jgi:ABC-type iron transport system FetAB ATPase subunit
VLRTDQLTISADTWGGRPLIAGLSLTVDRSQVVGVTGPSGCGKTTLLRSIAGLIDITAGTITLENTSPHDLGWPAFRRRVCLVPQRPVVWDGSVRSNLQRPFEFETIGTTYDAPRAEALLDRMGLSGVIDQEAATLSEGQRQRVCLVRSLLIESDVLLLDEPTSALDGKAVGRVEAVLADEVSTRGLGVLIATHDPVQAQRICTRVMDLSSLCVGGEAAHA